MEYTHLKYAAGEIVNVLTAAHICGWKVVPRTGGGSPIDHAKLGYDAGFYYKNNAGELIESSVTWNPCGDEPWSKEQAWHVIRLMEHRDAEYYAKNVYEFYRFPKLEDGFLRLPHRWLVTAALISWRQLDQQEQGEKHGVEFHHGV